MKKHGDVYGDLALMIFPALSSSWINSHSSLHCSCVMGYTLAGNSLGVSGLSLNVWSHFLGGGNLLNVFCLNIS